MQHQISFQDLLSGKTFQEPLAATKDVTSKQSSKRFVTSGGGQDHIVPLPPKNKWLPFGTIVGDGWSVAWRVYDAQFWGVPQRRKRIYLIADFGSERAGEILSFSEGLCGDSAESGEAREGTAADVEGSAGRSDSVGFTNRQAVCYGIDQQGGKGGANYQTNVSPTLCSDSHGTPHAVCFRKSSKPGVDGSGERWVEDEKTNTLNTFEFHSEVRTPELVCYPDKARSLCARHNSSPCIDRGQNVVCYGVDCRNAKLDEEKCHTIQAKANGGGFSLNCTPSVVYRQDGFAGYSEGVGTLKASGGDMGGVRKASSLSVFDARGNGNGETVPTITGDHQNRVSDYTCICVERNTDE